MLNKKKILTTLLDGTLLSDLFSRHIKFIFVLTLLTLIHITNRMNAEKIYIEIAAVKSENKILQTAAALSLSKLMFASKESEVLKLVKEKELKLYSPSKPPYTVYIPKK